MEDAEVVLRRAPLFEGLDEESARALRRQMSDVKLTRGEHLFLEGQDGDRLYVVLDGKIKLTRAAADGRENLLSVLGPGEMFGELSLFDPRPRTSSASAVTDATVAALAHDDAAGLAARAAGRRRCTCCRRWPGGCAGPTTWWPTWSSPTCRGGWRRTCSTWPTGSASRTRDGLHVHHDLTQEELAQLVGASRETVNKALADFAARGWLQISARSVLILDTERLRRRAR